MALLTPIADSLWSATAPLRFWGIETGARMTLVRLRAGGLFVHSPLPLDGELGTEVDALGPVVAVVAPSRFHHLSGYSDAIVPIGRNRSSGDDSVPANPPYMSTPPGRMKLT